MSIISEYHLQQIHKSFPEITILQFEVVVMYSAGFKQSEIAKLKKVSRQSICKTLNECKGKFNLENIEQIRCIFLTRILLCMDI